MIRILKPFLLLLLIVSVVSPLHAASYQGESPIPCDTVVVSFCFRTGDALLLKDYRGNQKSLGILNKFFSESGSDALQSISIVGSASPEGSPVLNAKLANQRAKALRGYIMWRYPQFTMDKFSLSIRQDSDGDWLRAIEEDPDVPRRERVLQILRSPASLQTKWANIQLLAGNPASYIGQNIFPYLRNAVSCILVFKSKPQNYPETTLQETPAEQELQSITAEQELPSTTASDTVSGKQISLSTAESVVDSITDSVANPVTGFQTVSSTQSVTESITTLEAQGWLPLWAVKTDLMLWGGLMPGFKTGAWTPNLLAELYFARRWSVQIGGAYSDWKGWGKGNRLHAVSAADLEMRYWPGTPSGYKGFYVGAYGLYGQYDVQEDVSGQTGSFWNAGVGIGYLLPVSRHWAFELEVRGGYRSAKNELYDIEPEHYYYDRRTTQGKFVPQVRLLFMYRFGKLQK